MKTIKVIDLLNKIANREIKDKTRFRINWENMYRDFYYDDSEENQLQCLKNCSDDYSLYDDIKLNDEVEIIEDAPKEDKVSAKDFLDNQFKGLYPKEGKKIEYIDYLTFNDFSNENKVWYLENKINEIIDKVNGDK